jgi:predicted RNA binding protein YcfA (HicA-like mRNA interferase family)
MSKLKLIYAREMEKLLLKIGFVKKRQSGSHVFYRHPDGRSTTVPFHLSKTLSRSLTREILREIKLSIEDYNELLKQI